VGDAPDIASHTTASNAHSARRARLQQAREVAAVADLGDGQIDRADTGVPAALSIAVGGWSGRRSVPARPWATPVELGHLGLMSAARALSRPHAGSRHRRSAPSLRSICSTAILSSAIVVFLSSSGF